MQAELMEVAEKLAETHPELRPIAVAETVADCAAEFPDGDPLLVEQAARARLNEAEQHAEMDLSVRLIIAANDSPGQLSQKDLDRLLKVRSSSRPADYAVGPVFLHAPVPRGQLPGGKGDARKQRLMSYPRRDWAT